MGAVHSTLLDIFDTVSSLFTGRPKSYNRTMVVVRQNVGDSGSDETMERRWEEAVGGRKKEMEGKDGKGGKDGKDGKGRGFLLEAPPVVEGEGGKEVEKGKGKVEKKDEKKKDEKKREEKKKGDKAEMVAERASTPETDNNAANKKDKAEPQNADEVKNLDPSSTKDDDEIPPSAASRIAELESQLLTLTTSPPLTPTLWPTASQLQSTLHRHSYDPCLLHFAICGFSGTGKSFLINSLRGLTPYTPNSAPTGQIETTLTPTRYPDPRTTSPYFRFVWYDIPGAGTLNIPAAQYFIDMGLYIFDFIVLVYGDRFTEVDAAVLEHARRFDVPVFVVRSRADLVLGNMVQMEKMRKEEAVMEKEGHDDDDGDEYENVDWEEEEEETEEMLFARCKSRFVEETRENFRRNMREVEKRVAEAGERREGEEKIELPKKVYIVSADVLRKLVAISPQNNSLRRMRRSTLKEMARLMIDEELLLKDMLKAAVERRYPKSFRWVEYSMDAVRGAGEMVRERYDDLKEGMRGVVDYASGKDREEKHRNGKVWDEWKEQRMREEEGGFVTVDREI